MTEVFRFKKFKIQHRQSGMKVGTDGILLGALADTVSVENILDVGTGTGLVALMLAQKCDAEIDAMDINEVSCKEAKENVEASPWSNKIKIFHKSLHEFSIGKLPNYNLIVCNPPYYAATIVEAPTARQMARNSNFLPAEDLFRYASQLLKQNGKLTVIIPFEQEPDYKKLSETFKLFLCEIVHVCSHENSTIIRSVISFITTPSTVKTSRLFLYEFDGSRSKEFQKLTEDFYL